MRDISINKDDGQVQIIGNDLGIVNGVDDIIQSVWQIINMQIGDFIVEPDAGFDLYSILGQHAKNIDAQQLLKNAIMKQDERITDIVVVEKSINQSDRVLHLKLEITAEDVTITSEGTINVK